MIAKEYYVVSGEHLINHDNFAEVFQITEEDLQNIEIYNLNHKFDLTEEEKSTFINLILNMRTVSIRTENYNTLVLALLSDALKLLISVGLVSILLVSLFSKYIFICESVSAVYPLDTESGSSVIS